VALPDHTNDIVRLVDDYSKQTCNVTAKHTHIERLDLGDGRVPATEDYLGRILARKSDLGFDNNGLRPAAQTTNAILGGNRAKAKLRENCCAEHGSIGASIDQEEKLRPRTISSQNFATDHGPRHSVIKQRPFSVDAHRCGLPFLSVCSE
jgi:hypothetical protein